MATENWKGIVAQMLDCGIAFDRGLSEAEVREVEERYGFRFPADLRAFLQTALPRGEGFPDWRAGPAPSLRDWLDLPLQGILFDVEHNGFWLEEWGPRPETLAEAQKVVCDLVAAAPKLVPKYLKFMRTKPSQEAFHAAFGWTAEQVDQHWHAWVGRTFDKIAKD